MNERKYELTGKVNEDTKINKIRIENSSKEKMNKRK